MDKFDERELLNYDTYDDYLDSFVQSDDMFYLRNSEMARMVAALGLRSSTEVLTKKQFYHKREIVRESLFPRRKPHILFSSHCRSEDPLLLELAERERPNRVGKITTIISIKGRQSNGDEISGFIDYEESLRKTILEFDEDATDWYEIFKENKRIMPTMSDLGYYNWSSGFSVLNGSKNFRAIADPNQGLIFESKNDRRRISTDPLKNPGHSSTRTVVENSNYDHVILFDHVVRAKL
ncbi:cilia- and flagella-associated protein 299-like [Bradysia coprophila]|uniref:cilia- and flagella-associated protein 299-like n=1 Tax=Bradysia coprophila TaxID=38358 RepID=UPI00187DA70D|nr:cilia- and flagella-associated protein 299-like [Bradysia coprophila]